MGYIPVIDFDMTDFGYFFKDFVLWWWDVFLHYKISFFGYELALWVIIGMAGIGSVILDLLKEYQWG